ncbi:tRNA (5-methylaminomethyl-2-thiouridine)(34)-methyltransferase MnmD [Bacteroides propionicifaciens]|jgi:tRNA U34 5-methylaminomethyl-2-thiouridine-forming methyltransferase MnmC|uniref:tRNA (5-methylaminomethyl-2-thiouridine)(34)-methyltransferase MnmD n=1 Tax=Bacteroides propionicifaciens TaxID=392838 RepID=UPI00037BDF2C|nr:tRNA (5-methylaminomethyl-2-thiouridine)(34)-methyltransferase MnmD [Bacteroides propionicifaciens]
MDELILEKTEDGSDTLFIPEMDEHYHSTKGALTETNYIFIEKGLLASTQKEVKVLEIGFGTGLNAIQTLKAAQENNIKVAFHTLELYPLTWGKLESLSYAEQPYYKEIHLAPWENLVEITPEFTIHKHQFDFTTLPTKDIGSAFNVIYFDAFAPEKQPNMWTQQLFNHLFGLLSDGGILTTYCAKGVIRRMLQEAGFKVERLPGPPNGKREILRATKF